MCKNQIDYTDLRLLILKKYKNISNFCAQTGFNESQLSGWFNNKMNMSSNTIISFCNVLKINKKDIPNYFFKTKVLENSNY